MLLEQEVNAKFDVFMDIFLYYFDIALPFITVNQGELRRKILSQR
jgi:hypothetical protein